MSEKDALIQQGEDIAKRLQKRKNAPLSPENAFIGEGDDTKKYLNIGLRIMNLPNIDINDYDAVYERLGEYFSIYNEAQTKPTVSGMANALNMNRQMLWSIVHDAPYNGRGDFPKIPKNVADLLKKAYRILEEMMENYMVNGKVNPVMGIFMAKNHFGYKDQTEYVVTPNVKQDNELDAEDIRKRYLTD